jgi:5-carboxymethyl-2-hydroxymuconic-semialdehyde dehydrogenase
MPHFVIEYSANLDGRVDFDGLCSDIRQAIIDTRLFEIGAVRVRTVRCDHYAIADELPENAFIDMSFRIGVGRSADEKRRAGETIFAAVAARLAPLFETPHFALSLEVREIDPELSWKKTPFIRACARPDGAWGNSMSKLEDNIARAEQYLARFRAEGIKNQINGEAVPAKGGETFETISPIDLKPLAKVARGNAADIDVAAKAAKAAFPAWAAMAGDARKKLLHKIADAIEARAEEIAFVECMDTGQSLKFMAKAALRGAENFRFFADRAPEARDGKVLRAGNQVNMTTRVPIGPVGIITPWNTPFMLSTWKIAPALPPAARSCTSRRSFAADGSAAGRDRGGRLPKGVWNLVNGFGEDAGKALTEHPAIKAIGFVGEPHRLDDHETGRRHAEARAFRAGRQEPGDRVRRCRSGPRRGCGSVHDLLAERRALHLVVPAVGRISVYDAFTASWRTGRNIRIGHPLDPETVVGR